MSVALTKRASRIRLRDLEGVIESGLPTFIEVGQALLEIRDSRLYREHHKTFELYCQEKWELTRRHVNRVIGAAEVVSILGPTGPITERQARELAPLKDKPDQMREAFAEASSNGAPTSAKVKEAVERRLPGPKTADRQARETGVPVEASDGRIYLGKDAENSDWLKFRQWAEDIDRMLPADQLVVPNFGADAYKHARRVRDYADKFLIHNGKAQ